MGKDKAMFPMSTEPWNEARTKTHVPTFMRRVQSQLLRSSLIPQDATKRSSCVMSSLASPEPLFRKKRARAHLIRLRRRVLYWAACLDLCLTLVNALSGIIGSPLAYAQPLPATIPLKGSPSHPNTISPTAGSTSHTRLSTPTPMGSQPPRVPQPIPHAFQPSMPPGSVALSATRATRFVGSDGRLELLIPAGAVTAQDLADAGARSACM